MQTGPITAKAFAADMRLLWRTLWASRGDARRFESACIQQCSIAVVHSCKDSVPGCAKAVFTGGLAHARVQRRVGQDGSHGGCELLVAGNEAGFAVAHDGWRAAIGSDDGGNAGSESLEHDIAEGVSVRGEDEQIHISVGAREGFAAQDSGE